MARIGAVLGGKYEIRKEIGRGGMSVVYLALDRKLGKQWALKEIRRACRGTQEEIAYKSLITEANLIRQLDHPAIPRIVDILEGRDYLYIVMDYIMGEPLDRIVARDGPQSEKRVIGWGIQLCDVLRYLHELDPPVIYRDMKPANVIVKPSGNISIIDFGIACTYREGEIPDEEILGTRGYAPLEQYRGHSCVQSDIFALGMTMHHLLTGADPRKYKKYRPVREWNLSVSDEMDRIIERCVQPNIWDRYQDCRALKEDLRRVERGAFAGRRSKWRNKKRYFLLSVFVLVGVCLSVGIVQRDAAQANSESAYKKYVAVSPSVSLEDKVESYTKAVSIYPERTQAYLKMIEAYESQGHFYREESDRFLALLYANREQIKEADPSGREMTQLNFSIGRMYFLYYAETDGSYDFSERVQKAYPFFRENYEKRMDRKDVSGKDGRDISEEDGKDVLGKDGRSVSDYQELSDCYYRLCVIYREYILSPEGVQKAEKKDYIQMLSDAESVVAQTQQVGQGSAFERLSIRNGIGLALYDLKYAMAESGVEKERVLALFDRIYRLTSETNVGKGQEQKLKEDITAHYKKWRERIVQVWDECEP